MSSSGKTSGIVKTFLVHPIKYTLIICTIAGLLLVPAGYIVKTTTTVGEKGGVAAYATFKGIISVPVGWAKARKADPDAKTN